MGLLPFLSLLSKMSETLAMSFPLRDQVAELPRPLRVRLPEGDGDGEQDGGLARAVRPDDEVEAAG